MYYPPTPCLGWIGQIKGRSLSLASARSASWLVYNLHPRSLTPIWSWMQKCTKPMPTHAQNPWAWVWAPNVGLSYSMEILFIATLLNESTCIFFYNIHTFHTGVNFFLLYKSLPIKVRRWTPASYVEYRDRTNHRVE